MGLYGRLVRRMLKLRSIPGHKSGPWSGKNPDPFRLHGNDCLGKKLLRAFNRYAAIRCCKLFNSSKLKNQLKSSMSVFETTTLLMTPNTH